MSNTLRSLTNAAAIAAIIAASAACSSQATTPPGTATAGATVAGTSEINPAGDIPDNQAFVPFTTPGGRFTVSVPEGWARTTEGAATIFTDKLNTVRVESHPRPSAATTESIGTGELAGIKSSTPGFQPRTVSTVQRKAGEVVLVTYRGTSPANPVTGKTSDDDFERYAYWHAGQEVILTLSGPVGADNVDPWQIITDSLTWQ
jgi:hypothetical protein